jgi:nucleotide-binding universal stress UspA family protein
MFNAKRILVPMDFSDEAMLALNWAVLLAKQNLGVTLYPTYVASAIPDPVALDVGRGAYKTATKDWMQEKMKVLEKGLPKDVSCKSLYASGNPAEEIVKFCAQKKIDLVITTTHGRKGISHLLHGSVAEQIVRTAPCPVLVLHLNQTK